MASPKAKILSQNGGLIPGFCLESGAVRR